MDSWLKEVDALEDSLDKLKSVYDKNKRKVKPLEKPKPKPEKPADKKIDPSKDVESEEDEIQPGNKDSRERTEGDKKQTKDS